MGGVKGIIWGLEECLGGKEVHSVRILLVASSLENPHRDAGKGSEGTLETFSLFLIKMMPENRIHIEASYMPFNKKYASLHFSPLPRNHSGSKRKEEFLLKFWT